LGACRFPRFLRWLYLGSLAPHQTVAVKQPGLLTAPLRWF
jgi:hypothetical protein